ncbi:MAG TPA: DUF6064 family protein [Ignavibacteriaceae bacterium]|nr:DUF6064 family protein [Ignavibacteriaceae bacterium]
MKLPFTTDQFLRVFSEYNQKIFPMQIIFYLAAFSAVYLIFVKNKYSGKIISLVISIFWLWVGIVYHIIFFSSINKAAYVFGSLFILEGLMIFIFGFIQDKLVFGNGKNIYSRTGIIFIVYALIIYPVLGYFFGRVFPYSITLGLPCPTTIFTFGMLLLSEKKMPLAILIIPLLWSILGFTAALNFSVYEDFGLILSGLIGFVMLVIRDRRIKLRAEAA